MKGVLVSSLLILFPVVALAQTDPASVEAQRTLVNGFCEGCHDDSLKSGGFSWTEVDLDRPEANAEQVERIIRKVRSGMMPPAGAPRPAAASLKAFASGLE